MAQWWRCQASNTGAMGSISFLVGELGPHVLCGTGRIKKKRERGLKHEGPVCDTSVGPTGSYQSFHWQRNQVCLLLWFFSVTFPEGADRGLLYHEKGLMSWTTLDSEYLIVWSTSLDHPSPGEAKLVSTHLSCLSLLCAGETRGEELGFLIMAGNQQPVHA